MDTGNAKKLLGQQQLLYEITSFEWLKIILLKKTYIYKYFLNFYCLDMLHEVSTFPTKLLVHSGDGCHAKPTASSSSSMAFCVSWGTVEFFSPRTWRWISLGWVVVAALLWPVSVIEGWLNSKGKDAQRYKLWTLVVHIVLRCFFPWFHLFFDIFAVTTNPKFWAGRRATKTVCYE